MASNQSPEDATSESLEGQPPRRNFLTVASGSALAGLLGGYGTFACMLGEFVYPAANKSRGWLFVCTVDHLAEGEALDFTVSDRRKGGCRAAGSRDGRKRISSLCPASVRILVAGFTGSLKTIASFVRAIMVLLIGTESRFPGHRRPRISHWSDSHSRWRTDCCFWRFPWNRLWRVP
jgi:fluoride ion exporter CrcB/FEX